MERSIRRRAAIAQVFNAMAESGPDPVASLRAAEREQLVAQNAARNMSDLEDMVLLSNTLMPGQRISGTVFFARTDSLHYTAVLRVPVHLRNLSGAELGNLVFEFPFRWKKWHGMIIQQNGCDVLHCLPLFGGAGSTH
jgi:hypothetical protein